MVGGVSALIEFSLLICSVEILLLDYRIGNILAFAVTNIFTFLLTSRYVFPGSSSAKNTEALLFALCLIGGLFVNQVVLWMLVEFSSLDYKLAKGTAIGVTVVWNFYTRKHFVFKNRVISTNAATSNSKENF